MNNKCTTSAHKQECKKYKEKTTGQFSDRTLHELTGQERDVINTIYVTGGDHEQLGLSTVHFHEIKQQALTKLYNYLQSVKAEEQRKERAVQKIELKKRAEVIRRISRMKFNSKEL